MKILQKFAAVLVFCSAVLFASSADARVVQICDMGAYALYNEGNAVLASLDYPYRLTELTHIGRVSKDSDYDLYLSSIGAKGEAAVVSFFCNDRGFVSKIIIMADGNKPNTGAYVGDALAALLIAMGVSLDEFTALAQSPLVGDSTYDTVWAHALGRRIIQAIHGDTDAKGNLIMTVRLTAEDS